MTYTKNVWQSGDTLTAVKMNNIEVGLEAVAQELSNVTAGLTEEEVKALAQEVAQGVAATAVAPKLDTVVYEADKVTFALKSEIPDVSDFVRSNDVYTKGEIDAKLVGAMTYKGAVETEAQLPQDAQVGDMYDVTKTGHNFAWNGESWDDLGGSVDLSGLLTKEEAAATYQVKGDYQPVGDYALKSEVAVKLDTTTYEADKATFALKSEIPNVDGFATKEELSGYQPKGDYQVAGDYALKSEIPDVSGKLDASVYEADKPTFALKSEIPSVEGLVSAEQLNTKLANYATTEVVEAEFASYDKTIKGEIEAGYTSKEQFAEAGVHYLGSFSTSMQAEQKASEDGIYDNQAYSVLVYTVGEDQNGQIINNVQTGKTVQFLYWQGKRYTRTITNDGEKVVGSWASDDGYVALPRKGVLPNLFTLTTEADSDTVKTAMTATDTNEPITLDDLNKCLQTGYTLRFYAMQSGSVFVGFSGQAFTLTYIGFANPSQDPAIMSVAVNITAEGQYSVVRNGTRGIALTSTSLPNDKTIVALDDRIEALEDVAVTTAELPIALKSFTNKVHEKAEILGWFGVEDEAGLKSIIASKRPIFVRYGITLSAQPRYYKFPAEYVAFESNTQVKLVFEGLDTSDDSVVRYTILMNLDGTLIGEQSNISMVLEPLGADVSNMATKEEVQAKADSEHTHELADVTDINKLVNPTFLTYSEPSEMVQYLPELEQSYVEELLQTSAEQGLVTVNGQPWDAETNNWTIGAPYVVFGHFNESFTFEANLWSADSEHLGVVFNQVKSMIGTFYTEYQSKVKSIEERLKALESK